MKHKNRVKAALTAIMMAVGCFPAMTQGTPASAKYGTGNETVEYLDRGISAINTGNGMLVSWRYLANDADDAVFRLYRNNELIYTSNDGDATCYLDAGGSANAAYTVETLSGGQVISTDTCSLISGENYLSIPLDVPAGNYSAGDCSIGDVDGDGVYEIFLKWDPDNAKDNSQDGFTNNVYIDCYRLSGEKLWRIDLGVNIRAGAHYTQFLVADFDLDGKAEMTCKTADGTVDGTGKVIGDAGKDYRNDAGRILDGPEYYTLFDGLTGAALDTVDYEYPRGVVAKNTWGDDYGNRCDRFLGAVVYLDGVHPSAVSVRGYYTRMTAVAYDVVDKKLVKRWGYDSGWTASPDSGYGNGNHNCMPADVDGDGKQELFLGASCLDDDGTMLWVNDLGHGDAMHIGDFLPDRPGLEAWVCHEEAPYGMSLLDAATGERIFYMESTKDTGRCAADNVYAGNPGAEFWGAASGDVFDGSGQVTGITRPSQNFFIYWDGDPEREILDGVTITKINENMKIDTIFTANGCASVNGTKANPCLSADLFGDWREELMVRTEDSKYLRIYCTPYTTDIRLTTLMHDVQYRTQVAGQQNCYNQPPHASFYLGSDQPLPERPAVTVLGGDTPPVTEPAEPTLPGYYAGDSTEFIVGDINHDEIVDVFDLVLLKRELLNPYLTRQDRQRADTNADGYVSVVDVIIMQKFLLKAGNLEAVTEKKSFQYAIDAYWNEGVEENTNEGFRDAAYVNLDNKVGSYLEWTVYVPEDGNYLCTFGNANGGTANRSMNITTNGGTDYWVQDFPSTGGWTVWEEQSIVLTLKAGENTIRMTSATEDGGPNLDYLRTQWTAEQAAQKAN